MATSNRPGRIWGNQRSASLTLASDKLAETTTKKGRAERWTTRTPEVPHGGMLVYWYSLPRLPAALSFPKGFPWTKRMVISWAKSCL